MQVNHFRHILYGTSARSILHDRQKGVAMHALKLVLLSVLMGLSLAACSSDSSTNTPDASTGRMRLYLSDAPGDVDAVFITYASIEVNFNNTWVTLTSTPRTVNLMEWNNGASLLVGDTVLGAGHYSQIRLMVTEAHVVVDGQSHPLEIPSAENTGLKLVHSFDIVAGSTYDLLIDFSVEHSVYQTGNGTWKMKPVVRCTPLALTGSISGTLLIPRADVIATAFVHGQFDDASIVTASEAHAGTGSFRLAFLPPGLYSVRVVDLPGLVYVAQTVEVKAGQDTNLGLITLQ